MHESNWILRLSNKRKIKNANNFDKKIFVSNITYLFILSLINFNLSFNQF